MPNEEVYGKRNLTYSGWHRPSSLVRFMTIERANNLTAVDIDLVEYDKPSRCPLALFETRRVYHRQGHEKPATVTRNLAVYATIPAYVLCYDMPDLEIVTLWVRRLYPGKITKEIAVPPKVWAEALARIHTAGGDVLSELWPDEPPKWTKAEEAIRKARKRPEAADAAMQRQMSSWQERIEAHPKDPRPDGYLFVSKVKK